MSTNVFKLLHVDSVHDDHFNQNTDEVCLFLENVTILLESVGMHYCDSAGSKVKIFLSHHGFNEQLFKNSI